ncbi:lipopolysaccharide export LptBFGC system permease protein LptF [Kineosphaera limosa]|uniref:Uncharacterized protein n=1 Tax=Kineosphaera limosa NBRC 100340 TaxID=1184609 RepID=K6WYE3_9MICO|nr:hypothetical protein [Kineosphaera limosa]NYE00329.1 lipopolysaccharide export LptBFGC system permease protein LptF [Kineosphaera limosa]GAB97127.1 hypothetical protein KILIM_057_00180 [Kineosphaera limosa NBRC 100340]
MRDRQRRPRRSVFEAGRDFWAGAIVMMVLAAVFGVDQFNRGNLLLASLAAAAFTFFGWRLFVTATKRR